MCGTVFVNRMNMKLAGEMQSALEMLLALVTSSTLFTLHFMESRVFCISFNSLFLYVYCNLHCSIA